MTPSPTEGLSKEERRQRALEMLKAKPRSPALDATSARERQLVARERELSERARALEERERELQNRIASAPATQGSDQVPETPPHQEAATQVSRGRPSRSKKGGPRPAAGSSEHPVGSNATDDTPTIKTTAQSLITRVRPRSKQRDGAGEPTPAIEQEGTPNVRPAQRAKSTKAGRTLLEVADVDVHYGKIQALRGLNLSIKQGEVVALLGANGAGKSSTLRAISGMIAPSAGKIVFDGEPIGGQPAFDVVKHGISHVPEGRELFPTLAVEENLRLGYWPQRKTEAGTLKEALDRVYTMFPRLGERHAQAAGTMSGGEQQMLAFGRALMSSPRLLLVDEMSLGLAPLIVQILFDAVEQIHSEGASVIIVEQFVHKALRHAQRAYVLAKGEVVLEAPSHKLANDPNLLAAYLGGAEGHIEEEARSSNGSASTASRPAANGRKPKK